MYIYVYVYVFIERDRESNVFTNKYPNKSNVILMRVVFRSNNAYSEIFFMYIKFLAYCKIVINQLS